MIKSRNNHVRSLAILRALSNDEMIRAAGGPPVARDRERSTRLHRIIQNKRLERELAKVACVAIELFDNDD